jgi:hypothetical protein
MDKVLLIRNFTKWKEYVFHFLINSQVKDFRVNLNACKLKKYEKKQLIGRMKYMVRTLE